MAVLAIVGSPGMPIHLWKRESAWGPACAYVDLMLGHTDGLRAFVPVHVVSEEVAAGAVYPDGSPVYPRDLQGPQVPAVGIFLVDPCPHLRPRTTVVCLGDPGDEDVCVWRRSHSWGESVALMREAEGYIRARGVPPRLAAVHVFPERMAGAFRRKDGTPLFPLPDYERLCNPVWN